MNESTIGSLEFESDTSPSTQSADGAEITIKSF